MSEGKKALKADVNKQLLEVAYAFDSVLARAEKAEADRDRLRDAGDGLNELIKQAQKLIVMFLEPGKKRISTEKELVSALIRHFDGPEQREAQRDWRDTQS